MVQLRLFETAEVGVSALLALCKKPSEAPMNQSFSLDLAPFKFLVHTSAPELFQRLSELYPPSVLRSGQNDDLIYDFEIHFKRRFWQPGGSLAFRLGQQHFRFADADQIVPVFEWGLNWCVATYQSRYLCIHAAVLEKDGMAVILPAPPGSGKSTLCAMMMLHGWRLLSDEHCMIDPASGDIVPCVRPLSLKNNSLSVMAALYPQIPLRQRTENTPKGTMAYLAPSELSWASRTVTAKPRLVIFPKYNAEVDGLTGSIFPPSALFMQLALNCFNYSVMGETGFETLQALVQQVEGFSFEYNNGTLAVQQIEALLNAE
jgi:hypothetical protein